VHESPHTKDTGSSRTRHSMKIIFFPTMPFIAYIDKVPMMTF
jgi:hypothetical protein